MIYSFFCAIIAYVGLIRFQIRQYRRKQLTEARFAWFQAAIIEAILLSASVAFLPTIEEQLIGIVISLLLMLAVVYLARWFYKKL
jgi:hypothetical protein